MISKKFLLIVITFAHLGRNEATADNCPICPKIPKHYQELGCVGKLDEKGCCFESYDCPDLTELDINECHFKGRSYNISERIPISDTPLCSHTCLCTEGQYGSKVSVQCAYSECSSIIKSKLYSKNCIYHFDSTGCCHIRRTCGDKDIRKLAKCSVDGKTYREGEKFFPQNSSCHYCVCSNSFDESIPPASNKDCHLINCEIEIHYFDELRRGCVPVYHSQSSCCPMRFRCPTENDEVILTDSSSPGKTCKFGDLNLYVGQRLSPDDKCVECVCKIPPMVDCVRKENC
ncbi:uncharacterized protein LOC119071284 [Bradysia coprophila]|uniref:uncharacterized protein LOC119071284 n=1 Tax=Bradysia coprophila TaxID=38358 RepID=UPI00187D98DB|nr:uncharacterized protein LOC119071284 [Bradysia coprophila]